MYRAVCFSIVATTMACVPARAQFAVYGKLDLGRYTDKNSNTSTFQAGGGVGVYDDFLHLGPLGLGMDIRGNLTHGGNYTYRNVLAGPRVAFRIPVVRVKPYAEAVIGVGGERYTGQTGVGIQANFENRLTYGGLGGVDFTFLPHVDWRAVEVEVVHQSNGSLSTNVVLASTGVVLRF